MSTDARGKTGSVDPHADSKSGGIGDATKEKLTKLTDWAAANDEPSRNEGPWMGGADLAPVGDRPSRNEGPWMGDSLSVDRPDIPEGQRPDEPPTRVEAPKYQADGSPVPP